MHRLAVLPLLLLAACAGGIASRLAERPRLDAPACFAQLDRLPGLAYRRLPPRTDGSTCGLSGAVQLLDVGVVIRNVGPLSCPMTALLHRWVRETLQPAARARFGSDVAEVQSFGSYACRPRNNVAGAAPSEHGWANALDVAGVRLANGRRIAVLADWNGADPAARAFLRDLHRGGCRAFAVALGPDANAAHRDHLHFDMGRGPYCR